MSTAKTPREWYVDHDGPSLPIIMSASGVVALVKTDEETAHLIAAAPELLIAAQAILRGYGVKFEDAALRKLLADAVAKANSGAFARPTL